MATGQDVADFLGRGDDPALVALAADHVALVAQFVRAYTRGNGFVAGVPSADLDAVIVTATARLVTNPAQLEREQADAYSAVGSFAGWTLPEQAVLHLYRRRTA